MLLSLALSLSVLVCERDSARERERKVVRDLIESSSSVNTLSASNEELNQRTFRAFLFWYKPIFFTGGLKKRLRGVNTLKTTRAVNKMSSCQSTQPVVLADFTHES
jgi:hypothetical protein